MLNGRTSWARRGAPVVPGLLTLLVSLILLMLLIPGCAPPHPQLLAVREIDTLAERLETPPETLPAILHDFHPGDRVRMPGLGKTGTVLFVHRDGIEVDAGGMKLRVPAREAVPIDRVKGPGVQVSSGSYFLR